MTKFDWQGLLTEWNKEILSDNELVKYIPEELVKNGWLGYPGATEEEIVLAETRLGTKLPPSYREFLKFTNGWNKITYAVDKIWSIQELEWFFTRNQEWIDIWNDHSYPVSDEEYFVYGKEQHAVNTRSEYMKTALEISEEGDGAIFLLNPQIVTPEGEWEAWYLANWLPGASRHRSFWEMMVAEFEKFKYIKNDQDIDE